VAVIDFLIEGVGQRFRVRAPTFFRDLLQETLVGWSIQNQVRSEILDVDVVFRKNQITINSILAQVTPIRTDLIEVLNDFFLILSYLSAAKTRAQLLHCSSYVDETKGNVILCGSKNAGKSTYVFSKAADAGAEILADDLLLWLPKIGRFICLGFPLRMRRPVYGLHARDSLRDAFVAGQKIAYAKRGYFKTAPAGKKFSLDELQCFEAGAVRRVPLFGYPSMLQKHLVSADFLRTK
jgi:hypothetical protein